MTHARWRAATACLLPACPPPQTPSFLCSCCPGGGGGCPNMLPPVTVPPVKSPPSVTLRLAFFKCKQMSNLVQNTTKNIIPTPGSPPHGRCRGGCSSCCCCYLCFTHPGAEQIQVCLIKVRAARGGLCLGVVCAALAAAAAAAATFTATATAGHCYSLRLPSLSLQVNLSADPPTHPPTSQLLKPCTLFLSCNNNV